MSADRAAVITGGGTGIGLATAQLLARKGWHVTAIGLDCADDFPGNARFIEGDVTDPKTLQTLFDGIEALAALVTAAGTLRFAEEWQTAAFDQVLAVNVTATLNCARGPLPLPCRQARVPLSRSHPCGAGSAILSPRPMAPAKARWLRSPDLWPWPGRVAAFASTRWRPAGLRPAFPKARAATPSARPP